MFTFVVVVFSPTGIAMDEFRYNRNAFGLFSNYPEYVFQVWDFGGQEDFYTTHQCFLSTLALYLLVWNMEEGKLVCYFPLKQFSIECWKYYLSLLWFALLCAVIGYQYFHHFLNQREAKPKPGINYCDFPARISLSLAPVTCIYFEFLIGPLCCLCLLWLLNTK